MNVRPYIAEARSLEDNEGQLAAYGSEGNCVILAGPGSGKTKTITLKIARILEEELRKPQRLACITYSNECVGELRRRLAKLEVEDRSRLLISTVHSFALAEIVRPYAKLTKLRIPSEIKIASPSQVRKMMNEAYEEVTGQRPGGWFQTAFDRLRRQCPRKVEEQWRDGSDEVKDAIIQYEKNLAAANLMDFDGLVITALRMVKDYPWIRRCLRAKFPVLVIDEYQDLGVPLHEIVVALMTKAGTRIIAVGDPDQSVYGFTGAKPELLKQLSERRDVEAIRLKFNYRCAREIVEASKSLVDEGAQMQAHSGHTGSIVIHGAGVDVEGQARYAFEQVIPELLRQNSTWKHGDIAFLYRSSNEGTAIAAVADSLGFRYSRSDVASPIKRSRLTNWLADAARWCAGGWKTGEISLSQLMKTWRTLRSSLDDGTQLLNERARIVGFLFAHRDGSAALKDWLDGLHDTFIEQLFKDEAGLSDEVDKFTDLVAAADVDGKLAHFTVEIFGNHGKHPDQINLMTLHGSKGLEFQTVLMLGVEQGKFPHYRSTGEEVEESQRLFYVGVTRAKTWVYLMYMSRESPFITKVRAAMAESF